VWRTWIQITQFGVASGDHLNNWPAEQNGGSRPSHEANGYIS
jgi:hypothetical protein